jgi:hypothetical protein
MMRFFRLQITALTLSLLAVAALAVNLAAPFAQAQTNTTSAIAGVVSDPSGAVVPSAAVSVTNLANGETRTAATSSSGEYRVSQLPPGRYSVSAAAAGFEKTTLTVDLSPGTVATANVAMTVGKSSVTVEVNGSEVPLLHGDDAQITTTFTQRQILLLPNPGNDITFLAQLAPGSIMNTQSGFGNFSSFGLPGTSNALSVNGGYYNEPMRNTINSGATDLVLGANDIASVTVTSNAYNASFGGLGGAQISQVTRSGGNQFHGNTAYWWNGRAMNANDFFYKMAGTPRPFENANQWAAAVGGPIWRNKTFFFVNYEGLYFILPSRDTVYAPDASYQTNVLANLVTNGMASGTTEYKIYQNIFSLYNNAPGYSTAAVSTSDASSGGYGTVVFNGTASNESHEQMFNGRVDHNFSDKDHLFGHVTIDKGVQASFTSLLNPLFNAFSPEPYYNGQLSEQHQFSRTLSNQFLFTANYSHSITGNPNQAAAEALVPFGLEFYDGDMGSNNADAYPGGEDMYWPQSRNTTNYQFQDDLSWTRGKHTLTAGWTMHRYDVTDPSPSDYTTSPLAYVYSRSFDQGYVDKWTENFPSRATQPIALYTMGWYAQDQWKVRPTLTLTYGLRVEHDSNPVCRTNCYARLAADFPAESTSTSTAYNKLILPNLGTALNSLEMVGWQPRVGFAYQPFGLNRGTTLRGGFGMFNDAFPARIADMLLNNAPSNIQFSVTGPNKGGAVNLLLAPGASSTVYTSLLSARTTAAASATAFQSGFSSGASDATMTASVPFFAVPSFTTAAQQIQYPTYLEWSLAAEQRLTRSDSLTVLYVGNRSYHDPVQNYGPNIYKRSGSGFSELPTSAPNPNFGGVTVISSSGIGNYNGLVVTGQHRSANLTVTFNYQWSHALDEISNGGFAAFTGRSSYYPDNPFNLRQNYGNADYDVRQYVSGNYIYSMPHYRGPRLLVDNWQVSGTVFHSTGLPFSVVYSASLANYGGALFARQSAPISNTHCGGESAAQGTACSFVSSFATPTDFGQSARNQLFGPNYTDTDFAITKGFVMPHLETSKLKVGAQFFNLFNHPNFGQPGINISSHGSFGKISSAVSPPTSILGSQLGGDTSSRLIELTAKFDF